MRRLSDYQCPRSSSGPIAIAVGAVLGTTLPERFIKLFASVAFVLFGLLLIAEGVGRP